MSKDLLFPANFQILIDDLSDEQLYEAKRLVALETEKRLIK